MLRRAGMTPREARRELRRNAWGEGLRFGLRDVMKAILLAAALFAILRTAAPNTGSPLRVFMAYWPWICCGALLGVITAITASWIGLRALPWYVRLLVILVVGAAAGATLEFFPALGMLADLVQSQPDVTNGFNFCTTMAFTLAMAAWLAVALAAGWTLRARPQPIATQDAVGTDAPRAPLVSTCGNLGCCRQRAGRAGNRLLESAAAPAAAYRIAQSQ